MEVGFTLEVFKKKQVLADQRFAEKIQTRDVTGNNPMNSQNMRIRMNLAGPRQINIQQQPENNGEIEEFLRYAQ